MTTSLNVAEMLGLRWKWVNLSGEPVTVGSEVLPAYSLAVRENFYRGKFGSVKARSRRRNVPLGFSVTTALLKLKAGSTFVGPNDLVFSSRNGTPLNENNLLRRVLKPIAVTLSMPWLSWHAFRHTTPRWESRSE